MKERGRKRGEERDGGRPTDLVAVCCTIAHSYSGSLPSSFPLLPTAFFMSPNEMRISPPPPPSFSFPGFVVSGGGGRKEDDGGGGGPRRKKGKGCRRQEASDGLVHFFAEGSGIHHI